ncbi:hypothetical protein [Candidatus Thiosymbion oneisti]|uniref:hypothetical protein n=1 Tax=Candidatus Thiosymbion oneisti TaxID=589554 RepID=UPI000A9456BE|nr:hypothetical protein [Candidatus Thiosymbion oneisti]
MKTFNTAGPVRPDKDYNIPPLARWDADEIRRLIAEERYFVLHAPRQTGKTSCLLALMAKLNAEEDYRALYVNLEPGQSARGDVQAGMRTIVKGLGPASAVWEAPDRGVGDVGPFGLAEGMLGFKFRLRKVL